jgi:type IV pilus assembly protein PilY1
MNISPADDNRLPKDYPARGKVRQWAAAGCTDASGNPYGVDGRSLYVVRVDTGEILAAFGSVQDLPDFLAPTLVKDPGFDSPITGTPVAFPVDTGEIAREVLVGDADGVLWRLDLSSASPKDWNVEMLVDLYGPTSYAKEKPDSKEPPLAGRPLVTAPILSLKPNGDLGIHVTTGSDDDLFKTGNVNYVVSLTESVTFISSVDKAKLRAEVNWVHQLRTNKDTSEAEVGFEQVSGPMAVFDGTLYFTTYSVPVPTTNTCQNGTAYLYARDAYERHGTATVGDKTGGKCITFGTDCPVCPNSASARFACSRGTSPRPGVSIALAPACTPDPGTGGGSGGTIASTPPQFRLALGGKPSSSSGSGGSGSSKDDQTEPLPKPYSPARVDSWAFIVE